MGEEGVVGEEGSRQSSGAASKLLSMAFLFLSLFFNRWEHVIWRWKPVLAKFLRWKPHHSFFASYSKKI